MNWNKWFRQIHRWLSMAFTLAVVVNLGAVVRGKYANWLGLLAVAPLLLLLVTGLYLLLLPHIATWRSRRRTDSARGSLHSHKL
ncbi:MAG: hypothetical protein ABJE10_12000 [bacterium]